MKRFYVIEADTDLYSVFVHPVEGQEFDNGRVSYWHRPDATIPICEIPSAKFYGKLDALLINKGKIEDSAPIEPEPETSEP